MKIYWLFMVTGTLNLWCHLLLAFSGPTTDHYVDWASNAITTLLLIPIYKSFFIGHLAYLFIVAPVSLRWPGLGCLFGSFLGLLTLPWNVVSAIASLDFLIRRPEWGYSLASLLFVWLALLTWVSLIVAVRRLRTLSWRTDTKSDVSLPLAGLLTVLTFAIGGAYIAIVVHLLC